MLVMGSVALALLVLWYIIYLKRSTTKIRKETNMPLRDWLVLYETTNKAMRPAMACALLSNACELGIQLRVMDTKLGKFIMSESKRHDYELSLRALLDYTDCYPVDLSRTDESASATILALLGYSLGMVNAEQRD